MLARDCEDRWRGTKAAAIEESHDLSSNQNADAQRGMSQKRRWNPEEEHSQILQQDGVAEMLHATQIEVSTFPPFHHPQILVAID
jgi:hypothetical protein